MEATFRKNEEQLEATIRDLKVSLASSRETLVLTSFRSGLTFLQKQHARRNLLRASRALSLWKKFTSWQEEQEQNGAMGIGRVVNLFLHSDSRKMSKAFRKWQQHCIIAGMGNLHSAQAQFEAKMLTLQSSMMAWCESRREETKWSAA